MKISYEELKPDMIFWVIKDFNVYRMKIIQKEQSINAWRAKCEAPDLIFGIFDHDLMYDSEPEAIYHCIIETESHIAFLKRLYWYSIHNTTFKNQNGQDVVKTAS